MAQRKRCDEQKVGGEARSVRESAQHTVRCSPESCSHYDQATPSNNFPTLGWQHVLRAPAACPCERTSFCFQPSNPNNQGEDGVVFLRNKSRNKSDRVVSSDEAEWTVLLLQNKFWFRDTQQVKGLQGKKGSQESGNTASENADGEVISVVAKWRDSIGHLPATVLDTTRKVHTLRYVRILVTANPVEEHHFTPLAMDSDEEVERTELLRRANAAFVESASARFDNLSELAGKWVDETRAKFKKSNAKYHKMKKLEKNQDDGQKPPLKNEHLKAGRRAKELLRHLKQERDETW